MKLLSIIVLTLNRRKLLEQTIKSLLENRGYGKIEFIFVDNGSTDGSRRFLHSLKSRLRNVTKVTCVFNKHNFGVAGGRNAGLLVAKGDYIMTIDDDVIVPPKYDIKLIEAVTKIPKLGMTGISVESVKYPIRKINGVAMRVKGGNLNGACLFMPRSTFNRVGYFNPDFSYGGEDTDMYLRLKYLGLRQAYIKSMGVHLGKVSGSKYAEFKKEIHSEDSEMVRKVAKNMKQYIKTKNVYIPYRVPIKTKSAEDVKAIIS